MSDWRPIHTPTSGSSLVMGFSAPVSSGSSPNYGKLLTGGAASTFGNWTWVANAPTIPMGGFVLNISNNSGSPKYVIQLGHATSGSTQLICDKVMFQSPRSAQGMYSYYLPLYLPTSGSILARSSDSAGASTISVSIEPFPLGLLSPFVLSKTQSYGFAAGDGTGATAVDPGVTLNVKGAFAQLHPAISNPIRYMIIMIGNNNNAAMVTCLWRLDIAIGGAGSEKVIELLMAGW